MSKRIPPISNNPSKVQLDRLGHVHFEHPNLEEFNTFAKDFGFIEAARTSNSIYYRGYGKDPYVYIASQSKDGKPHFLGPTFVAQSAGEIDKAGRIPGAKVSELTDAPGGGRLVSFDRPDGTFFHVVHGQKERAINISEATVLQEEQGPFNHPFDKPRKGTFQRFTPGPSPIHKLGHLGYASTSFDAELAWYTAHFNFLPSDILHSPTVPEEDVLVFMHLDLGPTYSDHHVFFLQRAPERNEDGTIQRSYIHHTSYEVPDFDTQLLGHHHLASRGYKSVWGVGRHVLGSQIFDYWADPSGFKIEHYTDGDVINASTPVKRDIVGKFSVWGPEVPNDFGADLTVEG